MYYNKEFVTSYLNSLEKEIDKYYKKNLIKTLYIGGGTPSCLDFKDLKKLFKIIEKFKFYKYYEFTFECNISDINEKLLKLLKENKVNRLSIGVQSFNKKVLDNIGRYEKPNIKKINLAKKYFNNINIDLIYGTNNQSIIDLNKDLEIFIKLDIQHISTYSLILENNTILKINNYQENDDEKVRVMYDTIRKKLKKSGYTHYELSNFSKKGYESKHNLVYWNNEKYYGFGLGASGYIDNIRYTNTRSINSYNKGNYRLEEEIITKEIDMSNEMILGLRKIKGVSNKKFYNKFGKNINEVFTTNKLCKKNNNYYIAKKNLFTSNSILIDFI